MADTSEDGPLELALYQTLALIHRGGGEVVRPWELWHCLTRLQPGFASLAQQDLFECFQAFAERPNLACVVGSDRTWRTRCDEEEGGCGLLSTATDRVATWTVALPSEEDGPPLDLGAVLRAEARAKMPVPDWACPCCGKRAGARRLLRKIAPDYLVIQLLRFARGDATTRKLAYPAKAPSGGLCIETIDEGRCTAEAMYSLRPSPRTPGTSLVATTRPSSAGPASGGRSTMPRRP